MNYDKELTFAKELAYEAGKIMRRYFLADDIGAEWKEDASPLTVADTRINDLVISRVKQSFPEHGVLGEEAKFNADARSLWICDPIDGTWLFAAGIPLSVFCLALVVDGEPEIAVVYDPNLDRLYWAARGQGAYENDKRLDISARMPKANMQIFLEVDGNKPWSIFADPRVSGELQIKLHEAGHTTSLYPMDYSAALVAGGRFDGIIAAGKNLWDLVPGGFIAQEAGAKVADVFGNSIDRWDQPIKGLMAASPAIYDEIFKLTNSIIKDQRLQ